MLDAGSSGRRVSFDAQNERLPRGEDNTERTCQGLGAMPRRFAVAAWEQLESLHSEWSARTQGHVGESAQCRDPLAQRGR